MVSALESGDWSQPSMTKNQNAADETLRACPGQVLSKETMKNDS